MNCLREWRRWIRPLLLGLYVAMLVIALPLMIVGFQVKGTSTHLQAWFIAGLFVIMAIPISLWGILQHLIHYTQPVLQRYIVRILWMVPIYAINAWLALRFKDSAIYLDTVRECYEAYVIYNFMSYLLSFLRLENPDLERTIQEKPQIKHLIPICWLPPWPMGRPMISYCKHGVLQYTVVRPLTTVVALLCQWGGVYGEGDFDFQSAWAYLVIINNISQIWAMYCLVLFYKVTKEELAPVRPVGKFLCVKAIVFLTFWQAVLIAILVEVGIIKENQSWVIYDVDAVATGIQDFVICIEMFLAAIAHYFCFSHKPYVDYAAGHADCCQSFASMWDVSDVGADVIEHVRTVGKTATDMVRAPMRAGRAASYTQSERTPLLDGASESGEEQGATSQSLVNEEFCRELKSVLSGEELNFPEEIADLAGARETNRSGADGQGPDQAESATVASLEVSANTETSSFQNSYAASLNNYVDFEDRGQQVAAYESDGEKPDAHPVR